MEFISLQGALLFVSLSMLMSQLLVRQKQTVHLVFAIFCGSIAMMAAKQIGDEQLGNYQYIVGMGTCATCNGFWLVARALFRDKNALKLRHIFAASLVGVMVIAGQALSLAQSVNQGDNTVLLNSQTALYSMVNLLSSSMLVLTAWEGCRGLSYAKGEQFWQRVLFLSSYCSALLVCSVLANLLGTSESANNEFRAVLAAVCAIQIILVTQVLIYWRFHAKTKSPHTVTALELHMQESLQDSQANDVSAHPESIKGDCSQFENQADLAMAQKIQHMLEQQDIYLQTNLKVADLARAMKVSEYRISRVMRMHFKARNFNQLINEMRIEHAKTLLEDPHNSHWPIVVVGLESGFASVGPFTRAFKEICGQTPNQYRLQRQMQTSTMQKYS